MVATPILDNYLTDEQLAKAYKKSVRTIKRWRREGRAPPSFRHGNQEITHVDDAAAYLEAQRQEARAANGAKRRAR
jgi:predicted site-specific integrase-resolvase